MKTVRWLIVMVLVATIGVGLLTGCNEQSAARDGYDLYTYDTEANAFAPIGVKLRFDQDKKGFGIEYAGVIQLFGEMREVPTGYVLSIRNDVYAQAEAALSELSEEQKKEQTAEVGKEWNNAIATEEQVFLNGDYAFSSLSIDLIRRVGDGSKSNYTSIDGYYESANNNENIYLFKDGKVYGNVTDKDGNATYKNGEPVMNETAGASYVLNDKFIILTKLDGDGGVLLDTNGKPQKIVYLLGSITYPKDLADFAYTDDDYSDTTKALAERLAGKTVGLLTKTFYSTKDLMQLDFN